MLLPPGAYHLWGTRWLLCRVWMPEEQNCLQKVAGDGGAAMSEPWFVKCVDSEILHTELNAYAQQGYTIRWLFQQEWQGKLWITIVAERKQAQS